MKNLKLFNLLVLFFVIFTYSCSDNENISNDELIVKNRNNQNLSERFSTDYYEMNNNEFYNYYKEIIALERLNIESLYHNLDNSLTYGEIFSAVENNFNSLYNFDIKQIEPYYNKYNGDLNSSISENFTEDTYFYLTELINSLNTSNWNNILQLKEDYESDIQNVESEDDLKKLAVIFSIIDAYEIEIIDMSNKSQSCGGSVLEAGIEGAIGGAVFGCLAGLPAGGIGCGPGAVQGAFLGFLGGVLVEGILCENNLELSDLWPW